MTNCAQLGGRPEIRHAGVAIIGGGAAGTFLALNLARLGRRCTIFDRRAAFGRGLAYGAVSHWHRLNVPIEKIGRLGPGESQSFGDWYRERHPPFGPDYSERFVRRGEYGAWLTEQLEKAVSAGSVRREHAEVTDLRIARHGVQVQTESGDPWAATHVALCFGNQPPRPLAGMPDEGYVADVWASGALDGIGPCDDVLIVGTGATAVDALLELRGRGHKAPVRMLSRRGLLPLVDAEPRPYATQHDFKQDRSLRSLLAALRREAKAGAAAGIAWQTVLDGFREHLATVWRRLSDPDRRRFHRHVRAIWLIHRHRLPPDIGVQLDEARSARSLEVIRGRLRSADWNGTSLQVAVIVGRDERALETRWIVNCTGPSDNLSQSSDRLISALFEAGTIRGGNLGVGIDVDETGRCMAADGAVQRDLFALGSMTRTRFGEVTSAPQIRERAVQIAEMIGPEAGEMA